MLMESLRKQQIGYTRHIIRVQPCVGWNFFMKVINY